MLKTNAINNTDNFPLPGVPRTARGGAVTPPQTCAGRGFKERIKRGKAGEMKTRTVTVHEGELLGPVDWSYNFLSHFDCCSCDDAGKRNRCDEKVAQLRQLETGDWEATTDGGWPRVGWGQVLAVGMYDGWPYWKPVPSVLIAGHMGGEWSSFDHVTDIKPLKQA